MMGTVSRTARVSGATRNLKEAAGKALARRTEIAYEAGTSGRGGDILQSPIIIREDVSVDAAGVWGEGHAHYPGRSAVFALGFHPGQGRLETDDLTFGRSQQRR